MLIACDNGTPSQMMHSYASSIKTRDTNAGESHIHHTITAQPRQKDKNTFDGQMFHFWVGMSAASCPWQKIACMLVLLDMDI